MNGNSINNEQLQQELATTQDQVASIIESFVELGVSIYDFPGTPEATKGMITNLQRNVDRLYKQREKQRSSIQLVQGGHSLGSCSIH